MGLCSASQLRFLQLLVEYDSEVLFEGDKHDLCERQYSVRGVSSPVMECVLDLLLNLPKFRLKIT